MTFHIYDSFTRQTCEFKPLVAGKVSIYHCGLTVQSAPHLGHIRKEVVFDVLRRWLTFCGYQVKIVANVTDIDDKILQKSAAQNMQWYELAYAVELELHRAYSALGCIPPDYEPRATGHIPEMIELIQNLIDNGHAYPADDGSGDVYFDVQSWDRYGSLSGQKISEMAPAADADPRAKRDPRDFALWKGYKPGEPLTASWDTPWGRGRPGWHLECSAMSGKYLGDAFDIHGGGMDLRFPHHENEMAQSQAAGRPFATYWMHNGWVTMAGEKMSKSLGNTALVTEVVKQFPARAVRLYLAAPHYRSAIEYSTEHLAESVQQLERIDSFLDRAKAQLGDLASEYPAENAKDFMPEKFADSMNDDLGTPGAVAVLFTHVRDGNQALQNGDLDAIKQKYFEVKTMLGVLGLDPDQHPWNQQGITSDDLTGVVDALVKQLLAERQAARQAKDWVRADEIRDSLANAGLKIADTPTGAEWSLEK